ncbi:MAG TPA: hypothetical protein VFH63_01765 [candidate division Zixibacteria bacterium]|nr:hypothetical protein [candidate division Zixibacteria bacterium]
MTESGFDPFAPPPVRNVPIDVYTDAYRVSGRIATRHSRIADIVCQVSSTHLVVERATVSEYADPKATIGALQVLVALENVLFVVGGETDGQARPEMRIPKRPVRAQLALPPFRLTGMVHVPQGSRPVDGLLNVGDRFVPMTQVTVVSGAHPELGRTAEAVAVQHRLAHLVLVTDDERPDELLAEVLDRDTAERWLAEAHEGEVF